VDGHVSRIGVSRNACTILTITITDIVHRLVFYLKHEVSETGFCLRLQEESTKLGPIEMPADRRQTS
jgi:hypothetical protein